MWASLLLNCASVWTSMWGLRQSVLKARDPEGMTAADPPCAALEQEITAKTAAVSLSCWRAVPVLCTHCRSAGKGRLALKSFLSFRHSKPLKPMSPLILGHPGSSKEAQILHFPSTQKGTYVNKKYMYVCVYLSTYRNVSKYRNMSKYRNIPTEIKEFPILRHQPHPGDKPTDNIQLPPIPAWKHNCICVCKKARISKFCFHCIQS